MRSPQRGEDLDLDQRVNVLGDGGEARLRVAISLLSLPPQGTGTTTYARDLVRALGARPDELSVEVLCNEHAMARLEGLGTETVTLRRARGFSVGLNPVHRTVALLGAAAFPGRLTRQLVSDPMVVHYPLTVGIPPVKRPTVLSLHDVGHRDVFPHGRHDVVRAWRAMTYDRPARHATVVLTGSEHARARIAEVLGIPLEQIMVAYHGVDDRFTPTPGERDTTLRERFGLPERFVYYPASIHPHKNHLRLLEALALIEDSELGLVLTGAATPPRLREVIDHAQALGLGARVHHLGFVDDDDLPALYRTARAMVFPSMYEGFGLPPIEAMACGCPVASTHSGSLGEVCGDGAAVLEPEDVEQMAATISSAATDGPARDSLRQRGFARAAMFTWYEAATKTLDAYRRAVALGA